MYGSVYLSQRGGFAWERLLRFLGRLLNSGLKGSLQMLIPT